MFSSLLSHLHSSSPRRPAALCSALAAAFSLALCAGLEPRSARAQSMFSAGDLDPQRFVLVAAPVGSSNRYQLNIYEQVKSSKPCFAIGSSKPAAVNPLLATFDFTGICSRYIDANGYSVRVGPLDLAGSYRLLVRSEANDTLLIALPTKAGAGPEMVVAKAGGSTSGFHKLDFEPGWRLMRRQFRGRNLGHVYIYNPVLPDSTSPNSTSTPAPAVVPPASDRPATTPITAPAAKALPNKLGQAVPPPPPKL